MKRNLVKYLHNVLAQHGTVAFRTVDRANPTMINTVVSYVGLNYGFEILADSVEGQLCDNCGTIIKEGVCICSNYNIPFPNVYKVTIEALCWSTEVNIEAKTGEKYVFSFDSNFDLTQGDGDKAEEMFDKILREGNLAYKANMDEFNRNDENVDLD